MAYKDLHDEAFDETTIVKLEIFEEYAQAWIPTFVMRGDAVISIFDLFAGTGYDIAGVPGSPIRILQKIKANIGNIFQKRVKVKVFLNEFQPNRKTQPKFQLLRESCEKFLSENPDVKRAIGDIYYYNEDVETLFPKLIAEFSAQPSLVYLDENGIKFLSDKYLLELEKINTLDFIYYVSSSYFKRFGRTEEFKKHIELDIDMLTINPYQFIHRNVIEQLRARLPEKSKLKLYPYSLKKNSNIFGIIFCAKHPLAVDKFLNIAWKRNPLNGDANYDIDGEAGKVQLQLFEAKQPSKIEVFKEKLSQKVFAGEITNNFEALDYAYSQGHIGSHAAELLRDLKKQKLITYSGQPLVNYDQVYKYKKQILYKILSQ